MTYGYVDSPEIRQLSRYVREWEAGPDEAAGKVNMWEREVDAEAHPLVIELAAEHKDGPSAALAYMAEGSETDAPALVRWMTAGAYKGLFATDAAFCKDQFSMALDDHFALWSGSAEDQAIGFPETLSISEAIDWDEVAYWAIEEGSGAFYSIEVDAGVYVFDISIDINQYRESE